MSRRIEIKFQGIEDLEREFDRNLRGGGLLVKSNYELELDEELDVVLVHPLSAQVYCCRAQVVLCSPDGAGVIISGFDSSVRHQLAEFVDSGVGNQNSDWAGASAVSCGVAVDSSSIASDSLEVQGIIEDGPPVEIMDNSSSQKADAGQSSKSRSSGADLHERIRGLNAAEQMKLARAGELAERILLERMYGKSVWEALLRNPKLTVGEVGRIARMGNLPRPLLELILGNKAWLANPQVRRALLTNPRLTKDGILKALRSTPRHELKAIPKQTAYSLQVRTAAKKLIAL